MTGVRKQWQSELETKLEVELARAGDGLLEAAQGHAVSVARLLTCIVWKAATLEV